MINPNSPAFPLATIDMDQRRVDYPPHVSGLPIRLHIAAMVMQGSLAGRAQALDPHITATSSLVFADALIREYNRTEEKP